MTEGRVTIVFALRSGCPRCGEYGMHLLGTVGHDGHGDRLIGRECRSCGWVWSELFPENAGDEYKALQVQQEYAEKIARHLEELAREIRARAPDDVAMRVDSASVSRMGGDTRIDHRTRSVKVEISWRESGDGD